MWNILFKDEHPKIPELGFYINVVINRTLKQRIKMLHKELNADDYKYMGFTNSKLCGYNSIFECYMDTMREKLKDELPPDQLEIFLKENYNPNSEVQEFEINGKKLWWAF